jgi:hypothetical protein
MIDGLFKFVLEENFDLFYFGENWSKILKLYEKLILQIIPKGDDLNLVFS